MNRARVTIEDALRQYKTQAQGQADEGVAAALAWLAASEAACEFMRAALGEARPWVFSQHRVGDCDATEVLARIDQALAAKPQSGRRRNDPAPGFNLRPGFGYVREGTVCGTIEETWEVVDEELST